MELPASSVKAAGVFLVLIVLSASASLSPCSAADQPARLRVYVSPPRIPADGRMHEVIYVQLLDSRGLPARAERSITVSLSISSTEIGTVDSNVTIHAGENFAVAKFYASRTPGSAKITAVAPGLMRSEASITTVGSKPARVAAYLVPQILPANSGIHKALIVQLQDSSGAPVEAPPGGVEVSLFSSNSSICSVEPCVVVGEGETYAVASVAAGAPGTAAITPMVPGLASTAVIARVQEVGGRPARLKLYALSRVQADGGVHRIIAVQLLDSSGRIAAAGEDISVSLSSTDASIGEVDESATIKAGETYIVAPFYTKRRPGTVTVMAAAPNLSGDQTCVRTFGSYPERLAVYAALPTLPADGQTYRVVVVQLQDASGKPAAWDKDVAVTVSSSNERVCTVVEPQVVIPRGETYAAAEVKTTPEQGSAYIAAVSPGLASAQASLSTRLIDLFRLTVSAAVQPDPAKPGEKVTLSIYVSYENIAPATGVKVRVSSNRKVQFAQVVEEGGGRYKTHFTAPDTLTNLAIQITIEASKAGYLSGSCMINVTVAPEVGSIHLLIKDEGGKPIPGATAMSLQKPAEAPDLMATSDAGGIIVFTGLPPGSYTLLVKKEGYLDSEVIVAVEAGATSKKDVVLTAAPSQPTLGNWMLLAAIGGVAAAGAAGVIYILRGRKRGIEKILKEAEKAKPAEEEAAEEPAEAPKQPSSSHSTEEPSS